MRALLTEGQLLFHFQSCAHVCYLLKQSVQHNPYAQEARLGVASSASFIPQADEQASLRITEIRRAPWLEAMNTCIMMTATDGNQIWWLPFLCPASNNLRTSKSYYSYWFGVKLLSKWVTLGGISRVFLSNKMFAWWKPGISTVKHSKGSGWGTSGHGLMDLSVYPSFLPSL